MKQGGFRMAAAAVFCIAAFNSLAERHLVSKALAQNPRKPTAIDLDESRNGGRRGGTMAARRAATKRRNVLRHRKACRG